MVAFQLHYILYSSKTMSGKNHDQATFTSGVPLLLKEKFQKTYKIIFQPEKYEYQKKQSKI